jgi:hypothetical protein
LIFSWLEIHVFNQTIGLPKEASRADFGLNHFSKLFLFSILKIAEVSSGVPLSHALIELEKLTFSRSSALT